MAASRIRKSRTALKFNHGELVLSQAFPDVFPVLANGTAAGRALAQHFSDEVPALRFVEPINQLF
jgi:hypothetical protein